MRDISATDVKESMLRLALTTSTIMARTVAAIRLRLRVKNDAQK